MKKIFKFTVKRTGREYKRVFSGLPDGMIDDKYYFLTFDGSLFTCLNILWHLRFPSRKSIYVWEEKRG